jgi:hypothetical protein
MTAFGRSRTPRRAAVGALLAFALVALGPLMVPAPALASQSPTGWVHVPGPGFGAWTNGAVTVAFPLFQPNLHVFAVDDARIATTIRLSGIAEITPQGNFTAFASFAPASAPWAVTNRTIGNVLELVFTTVAPVAPAQGVWESGDDGGDFTGPVGNATVEVDVYLNATVSAPADSARVAVNVSTWPWNNTSDALGLDMAMVAGSSATRIADRVGTEPYLLRELANGTNVSVATLSWAPSAQVQYGNGSSNPTDVATYTATAPAGVNSTVRLLFTNVTGGYDAISYDPWVALNLHAFPAAPLPPWALSYLDWGAVGAGAAALAVLGVLAARRRTVDPRDPL